MDLLTDWYNKVFSNWREALHDENFRKYFLPNFVVCFIIHYSIVYWLRLNCNNPGMIINDPVYNFFTPHDFSPIIFFFTYSATILLLFNIAQYPFLIHRGIMMFVAIFLVRAICIHLIPLSPSPGIIPLNDPVTNFLADEGRIMNDLFFSGHIADLTTFYLLCRSTVIKRYILLCICVVAALLVTQRVHYTIDVLMAPAFSYASYWIFVKKDFIWKTFLKQPQLESN